MDGTLDGRPRADFHVFLVGGRLGDVLPAGHARCFQAFVGGQLAGDAADLHFLHADRRFHRLGGKIGARGIHHVDPDRQGQVFGEGAAENLARPIETDPHAAGHGFAVADEPRVGEVVSGARLARRTRDRQTVVGHGRATRAARKDIAEQAVHLPRGAVRNDFLALRRVLENDVAVGTLDAVDDVGLQRARAPAGKRGVSEDGFFQREFARAEVGVGVGAQGRFDAGLPGQLAHRIESGLETDADHRAVFAADQSLARGDLALVFVVRALHAPLAENAGLAAERDQAVVQRPVLHHGAGVKAFLEGRGEKNRRESRAERALALHAAVVFAVEEIASAHHGEDSAVFVFHREHRALQIIGLLRVGFAGLGRIGLEARLEFGISLVGVTRTLLDLVEFTAQGFLRLELHGRVERGVDAESAIHRAVEAERIHRVLADVFDGVGLLFRCRALTDDKRRLHGFVVGGLGDESHGAHLAEDVVAVFLGRFFVRPRGETVRALEQTGQHGGLPGGERGGGDAEVTARRGLGAVKAAAEVNAVQIQLHDLFLGKPLLDAVGQRDLKELAAVGALFQIERIARQLLCHRARALADAARRPVGQRRARHALVVHAVVTPEFLVLGRHDGLDENLGKFVIGDRFAVLDENFSHHAALAVVDGRGRFHFLEPLEVELRRELQELGTDEEEDDGADHAGRENREKRKKDEPPPPGTFAAAGRLFLPGISVACHAASSSVLQAMEAGTHDAPTRPRTTGHRRYTVAG